MFDNEGGVLDNISGGKIAKKKTFIVLVETSSIYSTTIEIGKVAWHCK
jgi:hypothetical protein